MIPIQLILAGSIAAAGFGAAWVTQEMRYERKLADISADQATSLAAATANALVETQRLQAEKDEAERLAAVRLSAMARDLAATRHVANGLRNDLATARSALSTASCGSVREHAATLNAVFGECAAEIEGLAGPAQGHAIDTLKLLDAWPRKK